MSNYICWEKASYRYRYLLETRKPSNLGFCPHSHGRSGVTPSCLKVDKVAIKSLLNNKTT